MHTMKFHSILFLVLTACVTEPRQESADFVIGAIEPTDCPNPTRPATEGRVVFLVDAAADGSPRNIRIQETWPMGVWDDFAVCQLKKRTFAGADQRVILDIRIR